MGMLCTTEIEMAETVSKSDIADFLTNATWAVCSTDHTMLEASPGAAIFVWNMLFGVPFIADENNIGRHRQCQMDSNTAYENSTWVNGITRLVIKYL